MSFTRERLSEMFRQLETELAKLEEQKQPEEEFWAAFERLIQVPAAAVDQQDRIWWWEQLYSTMERHGLTDLSQHPLRQYSPLPPPQRHP